MMFCLSVGEKTWSNTLEVVKKNAHLTHLFEIRLDYLEDDLSPESISSFILSCLFVMPSGARRPFPCLSLPVGFLKREEKGMFLRKKG
jgi:hypothetical protein